MNLTAAWQEIDKLRETVRELEQMVARQPAYLGGHPVPRCGDITDETASGSNRLYTIKERDVDAQREDEYTEVNLMPGDPGPPESQQPVMFYLDNQGKRYIFPTSGRLILVRDAGGNKGQHVEKDQNGVVTVPANSQVLDYVVVEPIAHFHNSSPPTAAGRIYPGLLAYSDDGDTAFYLVFVEGHGAAVKTFTSSCNIAGATQIQFQVSTDGQGNVTGILVTAS